jgi:hypothetical protein
VHRTVELGCDNTLVFLGVGYGADGIQKLTATGFQAGIDCHVNATGTTCHWIAFKDY